jgi:hypothetical protein
VRTEVLTLGELEQWCPRGTARVGFRLPRDRSEDARAGLVRAGLRVRVNCGVEQGDDQILLEAYSYVAADAEPKLGEVAEAALTEAGLPFDIASSGTTIGGGMPAHRWLEISDGGRPTGHKICVASDLLR